MQVIEREKGQLYIDLGFIFQEPKPAVSYFDWVVTNKGDQDVRRLYDRHYTRDPKKIGNRQFTRPGPNVVLKTDDNKAGWVAWHSSYRKDGFDAFECTMYRNESPKYKSSEMIKIAVLATIEEFKKNGIELPKDGVITYVNDEKIQNHSNPGYCFMRAGFRKLKQKSKTRGLTTLQISHDMIMLLYREVDLKQHLKWCNENIKTALGEGGEQHEAFWFQQEFMRCRVELLDVQQEMKEMKIKAWSDYDKTISWEALEEMLSPYEEVEFDQCYNDFDEFVDDYMFSEEEEWEEQ
ncbi:hypothetical protein [Niallia taxi]|uniref:hypothetical protein n=1 Tax=Niallia taxi TaxID=2499688 RepID=UPI0015F5E6D4|nr:hypothetical protein [Niallia taxi]